MANEPNYVKDRLRESANRGVISENEMMRRAESVSQAAIIVRNFEEQAKKRRIIGIAVAAVICFGLWLAC